MYNEYDKLRDIYIGGLFLVIFFITLRLCILEEAFINLQTAVVESNNLQNEINNELVKIILPFK